MKSLRLLFDDVIAERNFYLIDILNKTPYLITRKYEHIYNIGPRHKYDKKCIFELAIEHDNDELIKHILNNHRNILKNKPEVISNCINYLVKKDSINIVDELLRISPHSDLSDLLRSCQSNNMRKLLIIYDPNCTRINEKRMTKYHDDSPLFSYIKQSTGLNLETIDILLTNNPELINSNMNGYTLIEKVVYHTTYDVDTITKFLLDRGATIREKIYNCPISEGFIRDRVNKIKEYRMTLHSISLNKIRFSRVNVDILPKSFTIFD